MDHSVDIDELVESISVAVVHFTASRYLFVAGYVFMIYDHLLTFGDEVELIWMKPFNTVSIFFMIIRYGGPVVIGLDVYDIGGLARNLSSQFCRNWHLTETYFQILFHGMIHALVAFRVRALWGRNYKTDWILLVSYALYLSSTIVIATIANAVIADQFYFNETFHMCFVDDFLGWFYWVWIPPLLLEVVLFAMTMAKAIRYHKGVVEIMPVARVLYRDGIMYFLVIVGCTAINVTAWAALPPTLVALAKYFGFAVVNAMGCKLILNLRGIKEAEDGTMESFGQTLPNIELSLLTSSMNGSNSGLAALQ
ncbi:hypothetical protein FRC02_005980 [Tulasnella sp. 418]|nr:hypothetical protein FRC02_005980 [Tulasnella sp. 418]